MAQKLNKKLVFVVGSLLIALVVGGAGVLLIRYRYDAERHIRAGDQAAAVGDFTKAAEESNAENLLILRSASLASRYTTSFLEHREHSTLYAGR